MTIDKNDSIIRLLESVRLSCNEIQQALNDHLITTTSQQYKTEISIDVVTLENLKLITIAVKEDVESGNIGCCAELLLRIAANDFANKLKMIPEKKALIKEILHSLKKIHRDILHRSVDKES